MKTIEEIRRENLKTLVLQFGGRSRLAEVIGKSPEQISQWVNGSKDSKTGKPRGIRSEICRKIEELCNKPNGWLDLNHSGGIENKIEPSLDKHRLSFVKQRFIDAVSLDNVSDQVIRTLQSVLDLSIGKAPIKKESESEIPGVITFTLRDQNLQPQNKLLEWKENKERNKERRKINMPVTEERRVAGRRDGDDN